MLCVSVVLEDVPPGCESLIAWHAFDKHIQMLLSLGSARRY